MQHCLSSRKNTKKTEIGPNRSKSWPKSKKNKHPSGPRRVGPRRVRGPKFRAFFPLPPPFRSFCVSLGVFSWNFGGLLKAGTLKCARLEFSGCRVNPRRPQSRRGLWGLGFAKFGQNTKTLKSVKVGLAKVGQAHNWPKSVWPKSVWPKSAMTSPRDQHVRPKPSTSVSVTTITFLIGPFVTCTAGVISSNCASGASKSPTQTLCRFGWLLWIM